MGNQNHHQGRTLPSKIRTSTVTTPARRDASDKTLPSNPPTATAFLRATQLQFQSQQKRTHPSKRRIPTATMPARRDASDKTLPSNLPTAPAFLRATKLCLQAKGLSQLRLKFSRADPRQNTRENTRGVLFRPTQRSIVSRDKTLPTSK